MLAVLVLSVLVNVALCYQYVKLNGIARKGAVNIRSLQEKVEAANRDLNVLRAIAIESVRYADTNPDMVPVINRFLPAFQQLGFNINTNSAPTGAQP